MFQSRACQVLAWKSTPESVSVDTGYVMRQCSVLSVGSFINNTEHHTVSLRQLSFVLI